MDRLSDIFGKLCGAAVISIFYGWIFDLWTLNDKTLSEMTFGDFTKGIFGVGIICTYFYLVFIED